jgi:hypothetical protein
MLAAIFSAIKTIMCEIVYSIVGEFFIRIVF